MLAVDNLLQYSHMHAVCTQHCQCEIHQYIDSFSLFFIVVVVVVVVVYAV